MVYGGNFKKRTRCVCVLREREREIEREREREKEREENQIDIGRDRGLEEKRVVTGIIRWVKKKSEEIKVDKIRIRW